MKISQQNHVVVVEDGAGARHGLEVLIPAALVGIFIPPVLGPWAGELPTYIGALAFVTTAAALDRDLKTVLAREDWQIVPLKRRTRARRRNHAQLEFKLN